jgi:hypothetical protein
MPDPHIRTAIIADLTSRLRSVCAHWPPEAFEEMVARLADITLKYDGIASSGMYDRRTTDRLVADLRAALGRSEAARDGEAEVKRAEGAHDSQ